MAKKNHNPVANNTKKSSVRIIAGEYRRRLVEFIEADGLRPTPDRVRETVFNWLNNELINKKVLDCCAGSGALGFEALSRGANHVTMIEPNSQQSQQLLINSQKLNIPQQKITILSTTAQQAIEKLPNDTVYDVVFLDPPYALNIWQELLQLLITKNLVNEHTLIYIEADRPHEHILSDFLVKMSPIKQKKMGQIFCTIYTLP